MDGFSFCIHQLQICSCKCRIYICWEKLQLKPEDRFVPSVIEYPNLKGKELLVFKTWGSCDPTTLVSPLWDSIQVFRVKLCWTLHKSWHFLCSSPWTWTQWCSAHVEGDVKRWLLEAIANRQTPKVAQKSGGLWLKNRNPSNTRTTPPNWRLVSNGQVFH